MPKHLDTPQKAKIQGAAEYYDFLTRIEGKPTKRKIGTIAECFRITEKTASKVVSSKRARRSLGDKETRGGFQGDDVQRLGEDQVLEAIDLIEKNDYEGHNLDPSALRYEANLPKVDESTLRRRLRKHGVGRYIARTEEELDPKHAKVRVDFAKRQLTERPNKKDWRNVLFCDEFHYGQGQEENRHYIYRRVGTRDHPECIRRISKKTKGKKAGPKRDNLGPLGIRNDEETKDIHYFAIVGWNFKKFVEYKPRNSNGKMSSKQYIEEFLIPIILPLFKENPALILEEDLDGSHSSKETIAFKKKNNISFYLNARTSPDLSVVETVAGISKREFRKTARFSREDVRAEADKAHDEITLKQINNSVDSMPGRMKAVLANKGQKTQY